MPGLLNLHVSSRDNISCIGTIKNNWKWKLNQPLEEIEENIRIFSKLGRDSGRIMNEEFKDIIFQ